MKYAILVVLVSLRIIYSPSTDEQSPPAFGTTSAGAERASHHLFNHDGQKGSAFITADPLKPR